MGAVVATFCDGTVTLDGVTHGRRSIPVTGTGYRWAILRTAGQWQTAAGGWGAEWQLIPGSVTIHGLRRCEAAAHAEAATLAGGRVIEVVNR